MTRHLALVLMAVALGLAQDRFGGENERLNGFIKSPTEHIMNEHPGVILVRALKGRITEAASKTGVPGAMIEVRKVDGGERVRGTKSDDDGYFQQRKLSEGEYFFKVTRAGFQSVFGRLSVSKRAPAHAKFEIELKQGV